MTIAFVFPGQGSQYVNMLTNLPKDLIVQEKIEKGLDYLRMSKKELESPGALKSTKNVQLALLISGIAVYSLFEERNALPNYMAGHSVGAFSAAVASGAIDYKDALEIVRFRGQLMEEFDREKYGMGVIIGLHEEAIEEVVDSIHNEHHPVFVSNQNTSKQFTISGSLIGIKKVFNAVRGAAKTQLLNVSTPSHCPLFAHISNALFNAMQKYEINSPNIKLISNVNSRVIRTKEALIKDLAQSISKPVQWYNSMSLLQEHHVNLYFEMPPGEVLTKILKTEFKVNRAIAVEKTSIDDCLYLIVNNKNGVL